MKIISCIVLASLLASVVSGLAGNSSDAFTAATAAQARKTFLYASDFAGGTYRITEPGKYILYQDIEFEPSGSEVTDTLFPKSTSKKYPQLGGYFLGFFAAVAIEADDVEFDCHGRTIKMSERFHKHQRFWSAIELGSKPFISGQGPPQFSSYITSPGAVKSARNVKVTNCIIGRSSHHGIHGNNNDGVTIRNVKISDFEVGGIALNGARKVVIEGADIGPSLSNTFSASLSQAIFLDHLANTLIPKHDKLFQYLPATKFKVRGKTMTVQDAFKKLRDELRTFLRDGSGELENIAGDGKALPDGSAMYGVLLHTTGVAVADFGAGCALGEDPDEKMVGPAVLHDIHIHDLKLNVDQVTRTVIDKGPQVMGPAGDVVEITRIWDKKDFNYVQNPLTDAQVALAVLKDEVASWKVTNPITWEDAKYYFGGSNIPDSVRKWVAGETKGTDFKNFLEQKNAFKCDSDAMTHFNKGVVGMRLEFQDGVQDANVKIESLINVGKEVAAPFCRVHGYKGNDVHGLHVTNVKDFDASAMTIVKDTLHAPNGAVRPTSLLQIPRPRQPVLQVVRKHLRKAKNRLAA